MARRVAARGRTGTARWLLGRLGNAVIVMWAAATAVFVAVSLIPGDPVEAALGGPGSQASAATVEATRERLGLDRPLIVQYFSQLLRMATGQWGDSYAQRIPVAEVIGQALPATAVLAVAALPAAWAIALTLTVLAALGGRRGRLVTSAVGMVAASLPHFWLGLVLVAVFATGLGWLPAVSDGGGAGLVLPVLTLALPLGGYLAQTMLDGVADAEATAFALSARARGERRGGLLWRHTLRHAVLPAVALSSWAAGTLIGGAVVVETVFARPGLGRVLLSAVTQRDAPVIVAVVVVTAVVFIVLGFLGDAAARWVDPRGREATSR
ncbi:ABC transporter permease [Mycetocola reblochoni]|uniref:ABC transporter permease n=1 Tax=Mycetocola reblochoni TaxID=331618 RepID=UPI003F9460FD